MPFVDVRDDKGKKLLFQFDPARDLIEIIVRGERHLIDLQDYRPGGRLAPPVMLMGRPVRAAGEDDPLNQPDGVKFAGVRITR